MKPSTRLALLLSLIVGLGLHHSSPAFADPGQRLPVTGTSAEQFALMGGVFLILGAAFVFAPQIVSAVNGFLAAVFGRARKAATPKAQEPSAGLPELHAPVQFSQEPHGQHEQGDEAWKPLAEDQPSDAVSRLRDQISASWSHPREE